jgi:hypothetical protein
MMFRSLELVKPSSSLGRCYTLVKHVSVGFLWTSEHLIAETSTLQYTTHTTDKHPCPRWDSDPRSQQASGRRPTPLDLAAAGTSNYLFTKRKQRTGIVMDDRLIPLPASSDMACRVQGLLICLTFPFSLKGVSGNSRQNSASALGMVHSLHE